MNEPFENEIFEVRDGYAPKRKTSPAPMVKVRRMTLDEIKALGSHAKIIANDGTLRDVKINGRVRTWKRDSYRVEVPIKYGLYEYATFNTDEALRRFVVIVLDCNCDQSGPVQCDLHGPRE